jgi:hypothetical protein
MLTTGFKVPFGSMCDHTIVAVSGSTGMFVAATFPTSTGSWKTKEAGALTGYAKDGSMLRDWTPAGQTADALLRRLTDGSIMPRTLHSFVAALMGVELAFTAAGAQSTPKRETIQVGLIDRTFFPQPAAGIPNSTPDCSVVKFTLASIATECVRPLPELFLWCAGSAR